MIIFLSQRVGRIRQVCLYMILIFISERSGNSSVLYYILDLADFTSIREFAKQVLEKETRLDILINNAGTLSLDDCYIFLLVDF